jgi:hypothetical protein
MRLVLFFFLLWTPLTGSHADVEEADDEAFAEATAKEINKVPPVGKLGQDIDENLLALQGAMGKGMSAADIIGDRALRKSLVKMFENNPMSQMPPEQLRPMLTEHFEKNQMGGLTKKFPKIIDFMVNFIRHPRAAAQLVQVLDRPQALRKCGVTTLILMAVFFILKRKTISDRMSFFKRQFISLGFSLAFISCAGLFVWFTFQKELAPTLEVFQKTFL